MDPGSYLVMFTDGITEARRGNEFFGEERLDALLAELVGASAQEVADGVAGTAVDFQAGEPRDDIAVVVVGEPG